MYNTLRRVGMKNVFYETGHGIGADQFMIERNTDYSYPLHLHRCFEIIYLHEGEMNVTLDDDVFTLHCGEMIIIKPHQIHGLHTPVHSRHTLCIFSPELIGGAAELFNSKEIDPPVAADTDGFFGRIFSEASENDTIYRIKGFLYYLCDAFAENVKDGNEAAKTDKDLHILHCILTYIEENYAGECSLGSIARRLNYSYTYLSRIFSDSVGIAFCPYVTQLRVSKACSMLQNGGANIMSISYGCGFPSIRSFNRSFARYTGKTPSAYKKEYEKAKNG